MQKEPYLPRSPWNWDSTECICEHLYACLSKKILTGNTVWQTVQEKISNPKLLSGEDLFLGKFLSLANMLKTRDCVPLHSLDGVSPLD